MEVNSVRSTSITNLLKRNSRHGRQRSWSDTNIERLIMVNQIVQISFTLGICERDKDQESLRKTWSSKNYTDLLQEVTRLKNKITGEAILLKATLNSKFALVDIEINELCLAFYTLKTDCIDLILLILSKRNDISSVETEMKQLKRLNAEELVGRLNVQKKALVDEIFIMQAPLNLENILTENYNDISFKTLIERYDMIRGEITDKVVLYNNMLRRDYTQHRTDLGDYRDKLGKYTVPAILEKYRQNRGKIIKRILDAGERVNLDCSDEELQELYKTYWRKQLIG